MRRVWSRRVFLKLALGTLASACTARLGEPTTQSLEGTPAEGLSSLFAPPTPAPSPVPTPLPSPDGTAAAFLSAWTAGDYATMYDLLCRADRDAIPFEAFRERYLQAQTEATVTAIQNELRAVLGQGNSASASFRTVWQTSLFGPLSFDNILPLVWEGERWVVDWSSTLVLPALGEDLTLVLLNRTAPRGNIYERNGLGLAVQGKMVEIGVVPGRLPDDASSVIAQLSVITGVTPQAIRKKIEVARPEWFVSIAHIKPEVSVNNDDLLRQLPGVERRESTIRAYTNGSLAAHLVGYLGAITAEELPAWRARGYRGDEMVGRSGVEGWGETILAGKRGGRLVTLTRQNREAALIAEVPPRPGNNIYLSIDKGLQADAENILGQRSGAIVVLDPYTGFVLAMASYPRFDPNLFVSGLDPATWAALSNDPERPLLERGAQGVYPPGSVFKVVTMMAGMEKLGLTPDTTYTCLGTWNRLGNTFIKSCWLKAGHGTISLKEGLTQSCDVVFYEVGLALQNSDPQILPDIARACGLGKPTGITGIQEVTGLVPDRAWKLSERAESWFPGDTVNLAIGQGFLLSTPLQIANLMAAIANGGHLYRPQLVMRVVERTGNERVMQPEVLGNLPVSVQNLAVIREALTNVTRPPRGTAREAFAGATFTAAGKTGTAESGQEKPHAWFAGYAPAESPQVAIAVVLEHAGEGAKEAAPLFRQMVEAYLARFNPNLAT
ncbi:MAG: penicillin-binding protein 2 [Anaerolineae bacterium]